MVDPTPFRVVSLESRQASALGNLLSRSGLTPIKAPSMQEVPIADQQEALAFAERLRSGDYDLLVLMTGVGFRMLFDAAATRFEREELLAGLRARPIACRGPKPVAALKALGLKPTYVAPEPNTYRELLTVLKAQAGPLSGKRVVVQEYGKANPEFDDALMTLGANLEKVSIYAWALPDDLGPLKAGIETLCAGEAEGIVLTSQQQLQHLLDVAAEDGKRDAVLTALRNRVVVASVGPITTEALEAEGIPVDIEPEHPKMGHLAKALADGARAALARKRG